MGGSKGKVWKEEGTPEANECVSPLYCSPFLFFWLPCRIPLVPFPSFRSRTLSQRKHTPTCARVCVCVCLWHYLQFAFVVSPPNGVSRLLFLLQITPTAKCFSPLFTFLTRNETKTEAKEKYNAQRASSSSSLYLDSSFEARAYGALCQLLFIYMSLSPLSYPPFPSTPRSRYRLERE